MNKLPHRYNYLVLCTLYGDYSFGLQSIALIFIQHTVGNTYKNVFTTKKNVCCKKIHEKMIESIISREPVLTYKEKKYKSKY